MKKGTKIALIVASVLLFSGVMMMFVGVAVVGFDVFELQGVERVKNTHEITEPFEHISITTDIAGVFLLTSEDDQCRVECHESDKLHHTVTVENGTLVVKVVDERKWYERIFSLTLQNCSVMVYLPGAEYGVLDISSDTGKIEVPGAYTFSAVTLESDTGAIDCRAKVNGALLVSGDTGAVVAEGVEAQSVSIESDTGSITLNGVTVREGITVENDTGSVRLWRVRATALQVEGDTSSLQLDDVVLSGGMHLETDTGAVNISESDAAEIYIKTATGSVRASLLSPKICYATSDTGKVNVPRVSVGGRCEIESATGSITVEFPYGTEPAA